MTSFLPSSIQAFLYDFDGTLADSFLPIRQSFNHMLRHFGHTRELSAEESLTLVGGPLEDSVARLLPLGQVAAGTSVFRAHYEKIYLELTRPMPGATDLLRSISKRGLPQGVVTNKLGRSARELVRHLGWERLLPLCLGEGDGLPLKPDPAMILAASEAMGIRPERLLFVGDSPFDFTAARKAGSRICLLTTGTHRKNELALLEPDLLFDSLEELEVWIREPGRGR
ncbi:MAG: HAD family hydrolase [Nitrospiraceae bacterium]|nr:HAD family hydrolase [Nitrospiraceae bacterium]